MTDRIDVNNENDLLNKHVTEKEEYTLNVFSQLNLLSVLYDDKADILLK